MKFQFNVYNKAEMPRFYLSYPNKKIIGQLKVSKKQIDVCFNNISSIDISVHKRTNKKTTPYYDDITIGKYIFVDTAGWFKVTNVEESSSDRNSTKSIKAYALQIELAKTYLTSFGSLGTDDDAQGGLDRYCLYSTSDTTHSIMHIFMEKNPAWSIDYIDPAITKQYRSFDNDRVASYDFLVGDVAETFECIFQFNSDNYTVSAYKLENIGKLTKIYLSYLNLIKSVEISYDENDIKTAFYVTGGSDATGTTLGINSVNPSGNNIITNFSYFYKDMSEALKHKLSAYSKKMNENQELYQSAISLLQKLYDELTELNKAIPEKEESTVWTEYGLTELKSREANYKNLTALYVDKPDSAEYKKYQKLWDAVSAEIKIRTSQIKSKESQIKTQTELIKSYIVNIQDFLGNSLYEELSHFLSEDVFVDDSYIATSIMTESEIIEMQKDLYEHAVAELKKVCYPHFTMTVDSVNFPAIFKYKSYTDELQLGDIVTVNYCDKYNIQARLLKIHYNWDDASDFSLTFSSKTSLEDDWFEYEEIKSMASGASSSLGINSSAWNSATQNASAFVAYKQDILDLSLQNLQSSTDQEILIDQTGLLAKKKLPNGDYDPKQLWITNRNLVMTDDTWKSAKLAIGNIEINGQSLYGIAADVIAGNFVFTNTLVVSNKNNSITLDDNGFVAMAKNGYSLTINPDTPSAIFTIKNGSNTVLGVDAATSKFVFKGTLESTDGKIGGFTIGSSALTAGTVGLASSGNIQIWAGNTNAANAPFRVYKDGSIYTNKIEITGGSFKIGNNFSVDSSGNMKCSNADIAGKITALVGGKIGAFSITQDGLRADNERVSINWGNFQVSGHEATIGSITLSNDGIEAGYIGRDNYAHWDSDTGGIYASEYYPTDDSWWAGDGLLETVKNLYNYVHGGGWNPCGSDDCSDGGGCDGGGCETCSSNDCTSFDSCVQVCTSDDCNSCSDSGPIPCSGDGCDGMEGPGCV